MHSSLDILTTSFSSVRACTAQTATQSPHPVHLVSSTRIATAGFLSSPGHPTAGKWVAVRCGSLPPHRTQPNSWWCQTPLRTRDSRSPSSASMPASARDSWFVRRCRRPRAPSRLDSSRWIRPAPRPSHRSAPRRPWWRRHPRRPHASSSPIVGRSSVRPARRHNPRPRPVSGPFPRGPLRLNPGMAQSFPCV